MINFPFVPDPDLVGSLRQVQFVDGDRERFLTLAELANVRRLHAVLSPSSTPLNLPFPPFPTLAPPTGDPKGTTNTAKRPKLSSLVDATAEAELQKLPATFIQSCYSNYALTRGDLPHQDIEPTDEQLSAIHQLVTAGDAPYVDFSIFGPHGRRMLKRLTFASRTLDPSTGEWRRQELPGPPDFPTWWRSWRVFRTALLLLEVSPPEPLDLYGEHIRTLSETYGHHCWSIVYLADVRMRSEEFERTLRRTLLSHEALLSSGLPGLEGFKANRPWGYIFLQSVHSSNHHATAFWATEVEKKCLLFQCRIKTDSELTSDGTVASLRHKPPSPARHGGAKPIKKGRKKERSKSQPRPSGKDSARPSSKGGKSTSTDDTCRDYNRGLCSGSICRNGYSHRCAICHKSGHPAISCFQATAEQNESFTPKGKGKREE